jgi:hypothetical protein
MPHLLLLLFTLLTTVLLSGCSTLESFQSAAGESLDSVESWLDSNLKAKPAAGAGYVPMEQLAKNPDLPFDKAWIKQGADYNRYHTLYIAPVNTEYLKRADWWKESLRTEQIQQDVQNLATFMHTQFVNAFQNDPQHRLRVVTSPEKGSLTLALALTELVPSHVVLNALKLAGPLGSGLAVSALETGTDAKTTVAFEARVKDTSTGQTVAMFADREYATVRPIDLKGLTWYGNAEDIIKEWAKKFVEVANRRPGEIVKPASSFSLLPW